jgi:hypothetical protein
MAGTQAATVRSRREALGNIRAVWRTPAAVRPSASMGAPEPTTLFVPLRSSGLIFQVEIDYALTTVANTGAPPKLAILLHPWSRLGGNMNDPFVLAIVLHSRAYLNIEPLYRLCGLCNIAATMQFDTVSVAVLYLRTRSKFALDARGVGRSSGKPSWTGLAEVEDLKEVGTYASQLVA